MSNVRLKIIAAVSPEELEQQTNAFIADDNIELKQMDYETDGYERPYSAAIWYREKPEEKA